MTTIQPIARLLAVILIAAMVLVAIPSPVHGQGGPPPSARLDGIRLTPQLWNNCGPANLTQALSYFGWGYDQTRAANYLKPDPEDKNVSPGQMAAFVNQQTEMPTLRALWRYGGTLDLIKRLIAAGFPVIIESGFDVEDLGWMGHYETVIAYDDASQTIWHFDTYLVDESGSMGIARPYSEFDYWWRHFNRAFIVIFPVDRENEIRDILGSYVDPKYAAEQALIVARQEATEDPNDSWAWFNAGTSSAKLGRYHDAAIYFDEAFRLGMPYRVTWYQFGAYEAYFNLGRFEDVLTLANNTAATTLYVEETNYWRGMAYAGLGRFDEAVVQFDEALAFNRNFLEAQTAKDQVQNGTFAAAAPVPSQ